MFFCCNFERHRPDYNHTSTGECINRTCKWKIVENNYYVPALLTAGMLPYTPVLEDQAKPKAVKRVAGEKQHVDEVDPRIEYAKLRKTYLHFKDVLAGRPEKSWFKKAE
jgi:hypothetical protein